MLALEVSLKIPPKGDSEVFIESMARQMSMLLQRTTYKRDSLMRSGHQQVKGQKLRIKHFIHIDMYILCIKPYRFGLMHIVQSELALALCVFISVFVNCVLVVGLRGLTMIHDRIWKYLGGD